MDIIVDSQQNGTEQIMQTKLTWNCELGVKMNFCTHFNLVYMDVKFVALIHWSICNSFPANIFPKSSLRPLTILNGLVTSP